VAFAKDRQTKEPGSDSRANSYQKVELGDDSMGDNYQHQHQQQQQQQHQHQHQQHQHHERRQHGISAVTALTRFWGATKGDLPSSSLHPPPVRHSQPQRLRQDSHHALPPTSSSSSSLPPPSPPGQGYGYGYEHADGRRSYGGGVSGGGGGSGVGFGQYLPSEGHHGGGGGGGGGSGCFFAPAFESPAPADLGSGIDGGAYQGGGYQGVHANGAYGGEPVQRLQPLAANALATPPRGSHGGDHSGGGGRWSELKSGNGNGGGDDVHGSFDGLGGGSDQGYNGYASGGYYGAGDDQGYY